MLSAYRIVHQRHAATAFSGEGARLYGGRWNNKGTAMVYTSGSLSLATLELLVHLDSHLILQEHYVYFKVEIPKELCVTYPKAQLPPYWNGAVANAETRAVGDHWYSCGKIAVLEVPSVISPEEPNFLLNPHHLDFSKIRIHPAQRFHFDPRLVKR